MFYAQIDPAGLVQSAPGVGRIGALQIAGASVTRTGSATLPRSVPSPAWSPAKTIRPEHLVPEDQPRPETPACGRRRSSQLTTPARSTPLSSPDTTVSRGHRQAPQLRAMHHRCGPSHPHRRVSSHRHPLPATGHQWSRDHRTARRYHRRTAIHHPSWHPRQATTAHWHHSRSMTERAARVRSRTTLRGTARSKTSMNPSWSPGNA